MTLARIAIAAVFATLAPAAAALTPPIPTQVTDADVLRLLKAEYRESVKLAGKWTTKQAYGPNASADEAGRSGSRTICADNRTDFGPRLVAVCTSLNDAGHTDSGVVDLFEILDARGTNAVRIGARERGMQSGGNGSPGHVRFLEIGSRRTAFLVDSPHANMGSMTQQTSVHLANGARFDMLLTLATELSTGGDCDPETDGRACKARQVELTCTLKADSAAYDGGFYGLVVDVRGTRGGKAIKRSIRIPRANGRYVAPTAALERDGCDEGF